MSFASQVSAGDTAWMLVATALVLMMTPALGLFYAGPGPGQEHSEHVHDERRCARRRDRDVGGRSGTRWPSTAATASSAASATRSCTASRSRRGQGTAIPHLLFMAFEATFCIITAALISGAVVERMRFGTFLVFIALWSVLVYAVHGALGVGRRLASASRHARLRRRRPGRDGVRVLGLRRRHGRRRS